MPGFAHLEDIERQAIMRYVLSPEPTEDEPSTDVRYVLSSGYVYLRDHEELPGNTPPWGALNSIDLATGEIVWKVPFGNYLSHPDLGYGAISYGGPVVTATGVIFIAATPDKKFRAYDSRDGSICEKGCREAMTASQRRVPVGRSHHPLSTGAKRKMPVGVAAV